MVCDNSIESKVGARNARKREKSARQVQRRVASWMQRLPGTYEILKAKHSLHGCIVRSEAFPCKRRHVFKSRGEPELSAIEKYQQKLLHQVQKSNTLLLHAPACVSDARSDSPKGDRYPITRLIFLRSLSRRGKASPQITDASRHLDVRCHVF